MYGIEQPSSQRRGLWAIIGIVVLVLIIGGVSFVGYNLILDKDGETSTPEVTVIKTQVVAEAATDTVPPPPPTDTATSAPDTRPETTPTTTAPTAVPLTDTPTPIPTLRPLPEVITIGVRAQVSIGADYTLNLRDQPSQAGTVINQLADGTEVDVLQGPEQDGDLRWWKVNGGAGYLGWVVDAFGGETWLTPVNWTDQVTSTIPLEAEPTLTPTLESPTAAPVVTPTVAPEATPMPAPTTALTPTATSETLPTASPVVTATPVLSPTATPEGGIPSPTVGGRAQVTTQYQYINLRDEPGQGTNVIGQLANGTVVTILDGPQDVDDLRWWKVQDDQGNVGWAAERVGAEVLLVPIQ
jgi:hypothetical protein